MSLKRIFRRGPLLFSDFLVPVYHVCVIDEAAHLLLLHPFVPDVFIGSYVSEIRVNICFDLHFGSSSDDDAPSAYAVATAAVAPSILVCFLPSTDVIFHL